MLCTTAARADGTCFSPAAPPPPTLTRPGPIPGSGRSQIVFTSGGGGTQTVDFLNLEPVQDDVTATTAIVNADNAANAINYSQGPGFNDHGSGLVTVDNQETYEFRQQNTPGDQRPKRQRRNQSEQSGHAPGLVDITVNGGDPTASDMLIVNGTTGTDAINYSPSLTIGSGTVQVNALPTVFFTTVEQLKIDGQGGNDALTVTTPAGADTITYNSGPPGSGPDTGSIGVNGSNGNTLVPLSFSHLGNTGSVTTANTGGGPPFDILIVNGTPNSDAFTVLGPANSIQLSDLSFNNIISVPIHPTGVGIVELNGQNGDDAFNLTGGLPWSVLIDGGDPSASDSLNITGATGAVTVTMANPAAGTPPTSIQGYNSGPGAVVITGVEIANMNTGGFSLTVNGNQSPNTFTYTPTGVSAGTFTEANINTVFNFTNTAGCIHHQRQRRQHFRSGHITWHRQPRSDFNRRRCTHRFGHQCRRRGVQGGHARPEHPSAQCTGAGRSRYVPGHARRRHAVPREPRQPGGQRQQSDGQRRWRRQ